MSTKSRGQVKVMNLGKSNSLTLCFGDINSPEGATYQEITNPVMLALIRGAIGPILEGEPKTMSLQFEENDPHLTRPKRRVVMESGPF